MLNYHRSMQEHINARKIAAGAVTPLAAPAVTELAGDCGKDFVRIDAGYASCNLETIGNLLPAARASNGTAFVRISGNEPNQIKVVPDMAPTGIIIPIVNNAADTGMIRENCKYPPRRTTRMRSPPRNTVWCCRI